MKKSAAKKIIFTVAIVLAVSGCYYYFSSKDSRRLESLSNVQTEKDPDLSDGGIKERATETIADGSSREEVASGTYENVPSKNEEPNAEPPKPAKEQVLSVKSVLFDVPFTSQAPFGNWTDARKQDGCEEAAAIMAMAWVRGEKLDPKSADDEINNIAKYEEDAIGTFHDTSAFDTIETIFKGYFEYDNVEVRYRIGKQEIIKELMAGNLVIVPTRGQLLGNPNYTPPGPITHNLVVIGYDIKTKKFITNDPGTRNGKGYRYDEDVLEGALLDYPTGSHEKVEEEKTAMIVVSPEAK